jgi:hypothetical protein
MDEEIREDKIDEIDYGDETVAIFTSIKLEGKRGPYAVAYFCGEPLKGSRVTFLMKDYFGPELSSGTYVVLSGLTKKTAGWRAKKARNYGIKDEKKGFSFQ